MTSPIAIVGFACRYPGAASPAELWENVLAQRRAFRRLPRERLCAEDYYSADHSSPDRTYSLMAAVIENYEFDRLHFRVSGETYRSADLAHWLALDIANQALADSGFPEGNGLPRDNTAVYLGNTLTGEFSRAAGLRLRWPYVRRVISGVLHECSESQQERASRLREIEAAYKQPFPEVSEETLAGGLSNTIAGRISKQFDLKGGSYTVDGACASSLLAISTACSSLASGDCDVAIAGGVDLSLDPFELVGFAKAGALAQEQMRVYDARSSGFWPGEGCGIALLMRREDALASGRRIYALIRGWGVSSDGSGGITRPEVEGQLLAFRRAYRRAGFEPETVGYFEGHGTGTAVGDLTELRVLERARGSYQPAAAIGSIKANIGHTKAAAGIAGLIKAAFALHTQCVPPTTSCEIPHPAMGSALRAPSQPEPWPADRPMRAGVSAMGFGGINCHIVLEGINAPKSSLTATELKLARTPQDAELFLFHTAKQVDEVVRLAPDLSLAEMTDLAASLAREDGFAVVDSNAPELRAVVAATPEELIRKLTVATKRGQRRTVLRVGFLFPGQGSQNAPCATEIAQPSIVRDSLAVLRELTDLGIHACVAIGHSLGELTALCWAGAFDEDAAIRIASKRGHLMGALPTPAGAMAGIAASAEQTRLLIASDPVVIAGLNSSNQTIVSGPKDAIDRVLQRAHGSGCHGSLLQVSHAFHSPLVAPVAEPLVNLLAAEKILDLKLRVVSTVTGAELRPGDDLRDVLRQQITAPVRFLEALRAASDVDLWIEVGPGQVLTRIAAETVAVPVIATDDGTRSRRTFLEAVATVFEMGVPIRSRVLFAGRFTREFYGRPRFFASPCELAPRDSNDDDASLRVVDSTAKHEPAGTPRSEAEKAESGMHVLSALVAARCELPVSVIKDEMRLLGDLHLNSIVVGQIVVEAARRLGMRAPHVPLEFSNLTLAQIAHALEEIRQGSVETEIAAPPGVDSWVRPFRTVLVPRPLVSSTHDRPGNNGKGQWEFLGPQQDTLRSVLEDQRERLPHGGGVILCLPPDPPESCTDLLLDAARAAVSLNSGATFLLVQHGGGAASLARTISLEARDLTVCVVDVPADAANAAHWIIAEANVARRSYSEAHYDSSGARYEPVFTVATPEAGQFPLHAGDVLLVSGGGKGIGAECAMEAARTSGAKLAILGSSANDNSEVAANLARMRALGLQCEYFRADVTDPFAVRLACARAQEILGPITALLHCAGVNEPRSIANLDAASFQQTVAVKTGGLRNMLEAVDVQRLKLAVAFGSIIAHSGMQGEAHYSVANEWLARDLARWGAAHPNCRCLTLDWSVWAGSGMGERVARMEALRRSGVSPISIDEGVRAFREALGYDAESGNRLTITGRMGAPPTIQFDAPELPLLRFLERICVHVPGVELVCEADLSSTNDPYLEDHVFSGARLLPGVMALEAMSQVAMALVGSTDPPALQDVNFARPVIVPAEAAVTIRLAALSRGAGQVDVCLRSAETGFQADHFRATCRFGRTFEKSAIDIPVQPEPPPLSPAHDLYGSLFFQKGRFRRLRSYQVLRANECLAEAAGAEPCGWFNRYLPQRLVLGDPGVRDAALHAIQACIPQGRVLPRGAATIGFGSPLAAGDWRIHAREVSCDHDVLFYDVEIATPEGDVVERWSNLELRVVSPADAPAVWPAALVAPYLERCVREIVPSVPVAVRLGPRSQNSSPRRPDGKPQWIGDPLCRSHAGNLTMTVSSGASVGCDCEPVVSRTLTAWSDLLGASGFALAELVSRENHEELDRSATRVWCALESTRKAGLRSEMAVTLAAPQDHLTALPGWVVLEAGTACIPTWIAPVAGFPGSLAFAVMVAA